MGTNVGRLLLALLAVGMLVTSASAVVPDTIIVASDNPGADGDVWKLNPDCNTVLASHARGWFDNPLDVARTTSGNFVILSLNSDYVRTHLMDTDAFDTSGDDNCRIARYQRSRGLPNVYCIEGGSSEQVYIGSQSGGAAPGFDLLDSTDGTTFLTALTADGYYGNDPSEEVMDATFLSDDQTSVKTGHFGDLSRKLNAPGKGFYVGDDTQRSPC